MLLCLLEREREPSKPFIRYVRTNKVTIQTRFNPNYTYEISPPSKKGKLSLVNDRAMFTIRTCLFDSISILGAFFTYIFSFTVSFQYA